VAGCLSAAVVAVLAARADDVDKRVLEAEARRVAVIEKVRPAVVAVFSAGGQGGGSGVLVDKDGYALTNFHVVEGSGPVMQCGLPDGVFYDAVVVGIDKVGDVALIKLLPKKKGKPFPFAPLGDSDKVQAGDWSMAMGNPFLLATDFNPTVTFGLVSGVHRYQYPAGTLLEYTDCIQIDTSINPGNSGGPLFNMDGELIGINGRGSFEKRGRVNSGVGYAISINQIKNFLGHLRAGIECDHATLGAQIKTDEEKEEGSSARLDVTAVIDDSDVHRRGLEPDDELVAFAGRPITSVNQYKNVLGLFPKDWRVPMVYRHNNEKHAVLVRLMKLQKEENDQQQQGPKPRPQPGPPRPPVPVRKTAASVLYQPKKGFANYYFNRQERDRLMTGFHKHGDFSALSGDWVMTADVELNGKRTVAELAVREVLEDRGPDGRPVARVGTYHLRPETLLTLPDSDNPPADESKVRKAVRKAADLLRTNARAFPQEFWAQDTEEDKFKQQVLETQKNVAFIQARVLDALEQLRDLSKDRDKDTSVQWRAGYDYYHGKLAAFSAYVAHYNRRLGELRKDPPKRDPKIHRGWRMAPESKLDAGPEVRRLANEATDVWNKMIKDYRGNEMADRARKEKEIQLGLRWEPTGGTKTVVRLQGVEESALLLDPLQLEQATGTLSQPRGSGGLMVALYQYRRLLTLGPGGFEQYADHGGHEPLYPPGADGNLASRLARRVGTEVLRTEHAAVPAKWYFSLQDQSLLGFEVFPEEEGADPCEVYLSDYRPEDGRMLPHRIDVWHGDKPYAVLTNVRYQMTPTK
jgi:S1-C subfamily serine protease